MHASSASPSRLGSEGVPDASSDAPAGGSASSADGVVPASSALRSITTGVSLKNPGACCTLSFEGALDRVEIGRVEPQRHEGVHAALFISTALSLVKIGLRSVCPGAPRTGTRRAERV